MRSRLEDMEQLPTALRQAQALGDRVGEVGFDWEDVTGALEKLREEVEELAEELRPQQGAHRGVDQARVREELGDVLFAAAMVARKLNLDAEESLRAANEKFAHRWRAIERALRTEGRTAEEATLDELEALWARVKGQ